MSDFEKCYCIKSHYNNICKKDEFRFYINNDNYFIFYENDIENRTFFYTEMAFKRYFLTAKQLRKEKLKKLNLI